MKNIHFGIDKKLLKELGNYYHTLVYVGKENPFVRGEMRSIFWKTTDESYFPLDKANPEIVPVTRGQCVKGNTYTYESDSFRYFLQDYWISDDYWTGGLHEMYRVCNRHLLIIDPKSGEVAAERVFSSGEGTTPVPLCLDETDINDCFDMQWTGTLFKNKPPVVFYFLYDSFGCRFIIFLNPAEDDIYIRCDNRH